jgi:peptide methionine sulfoxide reductase MsrA
MGCVWCMYVRVRGVHGVCKVSVIDKNRML